MTFPFHLLKGATMNAPLLQPFIELATCVKCGNSDTCAAPGFIAPMWEAPNEHR